MNGGFFAYGIPSISRQSQLLWNWSPLGHSRSQVLMEWGSSVWFGSSQLVCLGRWWSTPLFYGSSTTNGFIPFFMVVKYMWLKMVASFGVCWILGWANWSWLGMTFESIMVLFGVCVEMGMGDEFFSLDRLMIGLWSYLIEDYDMTHELRIMFSARDDIAGFERCSHLWWWSNFDQSLPFAS